jgi:trimethylamine-N-oxide reductase (cytochrome c)
LKKEQRKQSENEEQTHLSEVSRRDFLVGAGTVVVGGAIGAGLLSSCNGGETITTTVEKTKTVEKTTTIAEGGAVTVTSTTTIHDGTGGSTVTTTKTVTGGATSPADEAEETYIKALSLIGFGNGGEPECVDVKNGRIVRIRPLHYDWKYNKEDMKSWTIERNGASLSTHVKVCADPFSMCYKKRVYSRNRILYPLQRVDFEPGGDPAKVNPQNRGKSKFKRISWGKALSIISSEMTRIREKYGPYSILLQGDGHGETKLLHQSHGCHTRLLMAQGGYTSQIRNADSWEGWYWGSMHVWGQGQSGKQPKTTNLFMDLAENAEMLIFQGCDLETTMWGFAGQAPSRLCYFWNDAKIPCIYICPDLNYGAAVHADKWIPVFPNTDVALQLAIAYIWISEGTYDTEYVASHVHGFESFKAYVMGESDGTPKTPQWASPFCGVPVWTIKGLAHTWAKKTTSCVHHYGGSFIRGPYSSEPARMEACLLGMQGWGGPGVNMYHEPLKRDYPRRGLNVSFMSIQPGSLGGNPNTPQIIPKTQIQDAILNPPTFTWGTTSIGSPRTDQFIKYIYPIAEEEGGTEIHMAWCDNPCRMACWNHGFGTLEAMRSEKIEFYLIQHPWFENDCILGDIILPVNTKIEEEDINTCWWSSGYYPILYEGQAIQPLGESKSDYECVAEVAKAAFGQEAYMDYTFGVGESITDTLKMGYEASAMKDVMSWEDFKAAGYWVNNFADGWEDDEIGQRGFYNDPTKNPLSTPTGLLEFESQGILENFPNDKERPPVPAWVTGGPESEGWWHDESQWGERHTSYPLLMVANHPRWREHVNMDDVSWIREIPMCKIKGNDGYMYEPVWISPAQAAERGIENHDLVKVYNERGIVLGAAEISERIIPGAVLMDHGSRVDMINSTIDRGGSINLICPRHGTSPNCWGEATSGYLVEVEKLAPAQMEEWRKQYPEAFAREYDPDSGLVLTSWVEGGLL